MTQLLKPFYELPSLDTESPQRLRWVEDLRLKRSLGRLQNDGLQLTEGQLVHLLLHRLLQGDEDPLIPQHLFAYTAHYIDASVHRVQVGVEATNPFTDINHFCKDLFQLILDSVSNPQEFYQNYQINRTSEKYWLPSLKAYIRGRIEGMLCDKIRTMPGLKTYKRSDYGLVVRASRTRVRDALLSNGYQGVSLDQLLLLWECFNELRKKKVLTPPPDVSVTSQTRMQSQRNPTLFIAIAKRYNQLRTRLPIEPHLNPEITADNVETQINQIGKSIRLYLDPPLFALDQPISPHGHEVLQTTIRDRGSDPEMGRLSRTELWSDLEEFNQFLSQKLTELSPKQQQIPMMLLGLAMAQASVGKELGINQSTVGRQFKDLIKQLLLTLTQWSIATQEVQSKSEMLPILKQILAELLEDFFGGLVDAYFQQSFEARSDSSQELLRLSYLCHHSLTELSQQFNQPSSTLEHRLKQVMQQLQTELQQAIESRIDHPLRPEGPAQKKLIPAIESRLLIAPYRI